MSRLHRPRIPLAVRVLVIERQLLEVGIAPLMANGHTLTYRLAAGLLELFSVEKVELHHRPALVNRRRYIRNGKVFYDPPANSAEHLVYLPEADHDIETRVRGVGAQLSDLAIARKRKRKERKARRPKTRWASRPLQSASRWPTQRMRP